MLQGEAHVLLAHAPEPLDARLRDVGVADPKAAVETPESLHRDRDQEGCLVRKVPVRRGARHTEPTADRPHRHTGGATLGDHRGGCFDQSRAEIAVVVGA